MERALAATPRPLTRQSVLRASRVAASVPTALSRVAVVAVLRRVALPVAVRRRLLERRVQHAWALE